MVNRPTKIKDGPNRGKYRIKGKIYLRPRAFGPGARRQVWNRTAYQTDGRLKRENLMMNKWGRIVSLKKHRTAKREKRLKKAGWDAEKGKFGAVRIGEGRSQQTRRKRGSRSGTRRGRR